MFGFFFFLVAPCQIGLAVGRSVTKDGLRILNFKLQAASLKHPEEVYDFYFYVISNLKFRAAAGRSVRITPCAQQR